jgi:membrane protein DedA with SNARE-associated domain
LERVEAVETISQWVVQYGYIALFLLLVLGIVGLPVPDEALLTFVGYLVYKGVLGYIPSVAVAFTGSVCGITLSYFLGHTLGVKVIKNYGYILHITDDKIELVNRWYERVGRWLLMFGYFIPGVRHLTAYVAGTSGLRMHVFAPFAYTGGLIWSLTFISTGYLLGDKWNLVFEKIHHGLIVIIAAAIPIILLYILVQRKD